MPSLKLACVARMSSFSSMPSVRLKFVMARNGGLADADRADFVGLDELDRIIAALEQLRASGRGHPTGGAATDDDDPADSLTLPRRLCHRCCRT